MSEHSDLNEGNAFELVPKKTRRGLPAEIAEQKAADSDPVFDAFRKLKRPKRARWLDIK